jgi:hypothetical protein
LNIVKIPWDKNLLNRVAAGRSHGWNFSSGEPL